ncbi:hypothetical protein AAFF_G00300580 [Aldrovandia affinis]|uniref:Uncharacterized protein n=1 Tax=Aldrovandia affinis TaxID=143900 RepID=A0AAD7WS97_9TELE|nr:hypothetical protein AAFF_G00300580 [Aldrovandia affinis]
MMWIAQELTGLMRTIGCWSAKCALNWPTSTGRPRVVSFTSNGRKALSMSFMNRATRRQAWDFLSAPSWTVPLHSWPSCRSPSSPTSWGRSAARTTLQACCPETGSMTRREVGMKRRRRRRKEMTQKQRTRSWMTNLNQKEENDNGGGGCSAASCST